VNGWDEEKQLLHLPTILRGRAWALCEALGEDQTDTYTHLKAALLAKLSPETDEHRLSDWQADSYVREVKFLMSCREI